MQNLELRIARYGNIIFNKKQASASGSHTKCTATKTLSNRSIFINLSKEKEFDKMEKQELNNLYNICKNITEDDYTELLMKATSYEEQKFYTTISDFFLQQRQKEVIEQGIF